MLATTDKLRRQAYKTFHRVNSFPVYRSAASLAYPGVWCGSVVPLAVEVVLSTPHRPRRSTGPTRTSTLPGRSSSSAAASFLVQLDDVVQRHVHLIRHHGSFSLELSLKNEQRTFGGETRLFISWSLVAR